MEYHIGTRRVAGRRAGDDLCRVSSPALPRPPVDPAILNAGATDAMWTNLGFWPGASGYVEAARALAMHVGQAAQLRAGDVVADYACGYGDSLRLWVEAFDVQRVVGVEPDPAIADAVRARVQAWGLSARITVVAARAEAVSPTALAEDVTAVVCVDAAYHFASRRRWLVDVIEQLPRDGRLGLADLVFAARAAGSWRIAGLARMVNIPAANLETTDHIETVIAGAGARVRWSESAGEAVLDGFCREIRAPGLPVALTRRMIRLARHGRLVDYRLIGAVRE